MLRETPPFHCICTCIVGSAQCSGYMVYGPGAMAAI